MKKSLLALLSVFILLFTACDTWMQDDDFFADIESDVKVANAPQISVYVRYALTRQGKTDPDGPATFKVEIPHEIAATTETEYGFVRWAAFTTDFIATGDNQSKNKDIYFIDEEDYNSRLLPHEIKAPAVVFENPKSPSTKVIINENRNDLFLVPVVAQRPAVSLTIPAKGSSGVVRNMSVRINFTKPMDEASFKNEAGEFDKITVTQGIQSFTADGDIEINSEDITDYFEAPVFSKNKKMLTLKFKPERLSEGYSSQSSVNITISKDVKDIYGFTMTDDDKISFSVGSYKDTLAPRITQLSAGRTGTDFHRFLGVYKDAGTINSVGAATKMTLEGAANAPLNDITASFYDTYIPYRVTDKVILRVLAEDISGSGSGQNQTGIETDVAMVGMRAYHMYNSDGSASSFTYTPATADTAAQAFKFVAINYQPQMNLTTSVPGAYKTLIQAVNENIEGTENDFAFDKGCLLEYDVSDLPDGLIRIDVAAVDMVQNSGFSDGGALSEEYGNAWASLFVIKDTTPPDASANSSFVSVDTSASTLITADHYFNESTYSNVKIARDTSSLADAGHARLRSPHDSLKWIVKPTSETSWISSINASNAAWLPVTSDYAPFPLPSNQGEVHYTYALMDDVGNISAASAIPPIYYDSVAPVVGNLSLIADEGYTAGVAKDNVLDEQTLIIPITEETSGLKSIEVKVRKEGAGADYASPLSDSSLVVLTNGQAIPYTLDEAKKVLTFTSPQTNFNGNVTIKGIKLSDDLSEQGSFEINVVVKDAAAAASVHETQPVVKARSNTDSVPVAINQIYIPNLKKTVRHGGTTPEYWVDYNAQNPQALTKPAGANPRTDVYIKFTEATSGARIFDFAGSSMHLTADSMIYKINEADGAMIGGTAIAATPDLANNRLLINSATDAATNFAGGEMTVKITQVELAPEGSASTIALKIHDTATNPSVVNETIKSNEGSLSLASPTIEVSAAGFRFDTATPSASTPHGSLADRDNTEVASTATEASGKTAAELGYTNEVYVKQTIYLTPTASGIEGLTIVGDASFDSTTTITEGAGSSVYYDIISADNKTVRFKKAADDNSHVVLGSGTTVTLTISNLKLTAGEGTTGDGTKTVTVKPASFGGVQNTTGSSDYIILDRQPPVWNSANTGLYTTTDGGVTDGYVYPHPSAASPYGIPGSQVLNATDTSALYFYRNSNISIRPDVIDDNKKSDETLITYTHNDTALSNSAAYLYTTETGSFTATATDRAGNKSTIKTFNIVADSSFANSSDELTAIDNYMTLYKPEGAFIHRNAPASNSLRYVIKNADYQVRVKLGGNAPEPGEEAINGSAPAYTSGTAYNRKDTTTISTKIEKYYVSTTAASPSYDSENWKSYTPGTTSTFGNIGTSVDSNGTIIINLPHADCNPISLHLLDACGNSTSVLVKAASADSYGIQWELDSRIGSESYTGTAQIQSGTYTNHSDVSFYNAPVTLKIDDLTESCKFPTGGVVALTDSSFTYSIKSRIIAWADSGVPGRDYFGNNDGTYKTGITPPPDASDWYFVKQASNGSLSVQNNFPQLSSTARYKLFIILEDTVGNYEIRQIRRASNGDIVVSTSTPSSSEIEYWLFDNTPPTVPAVSDASTLTFDKVNTVDSINYYSDNSTVTYAISDTGSGIKNAGTGSTTEGAGDVNYPGFANRRTDNPANETIYLKNIYGSTTSSHSLSIRGFKDFAGNAITTPIALTYNSEGGTASSSWIKQNDPPTLKTTVGQNEDGTPINIPASVLAVNTSISTNPSLSASYGLRNYNNPAVDATTGGHTLNLTSKAINTKITVRLKTNEVETEILGWFVSSEKLTSFAPFYHASSYSGNEPKVSSDVTWDSTNSCWTYDFEKSNMSTPWHTAFSGETYFYPVNRAGLICQNPVKVKFAENLKPGITGSISYSLSNPINGDYINGEKPSTPYTIMYVADGINYTKSEAKVVFTTENAPTTCKILWAPGTNGNYTDDDAEGTSLFTLSSYLKSGTSSTYEIPLNTSNIVSHTSSTTGSELRIRLFTAGEDSDVYELTGPSGVNSWVYDNGTPNITYDELKTKAPYVDSDGNNQTTDGAPETYNSIKYIQSEKATLTLTAEEFTSTGAGAVTGIAHRQWRWSEDGGTTYNSWRDISPTDMNADLSETTLTFDAPAKKTTIQFRTIDTAGNISSSTPAFTLQRDDAAPNGVFTYKTRKGSATSSSATDNVDLTDAGRGTGNGSDNPYGGDESDRAISYSNVPTSPYYITHIWLDLSKITDKYTAANAADPENGIERSGIKNFIIKEGDTQLGEPLSATTTSSVIDLDGVTGAHVYEIWAEDNIGQQRKLQTFRTDLDGTAPVLTPPANPVQTENASNAVRYPATTGTYYLKNTKAYITLNIDDAFATYEWSTTGGSDDSEWHNTNHTEVTATSTSVTFDFDAPDTPTTYYFRGTDRVGNCSTTVSTISFTIQKDMWAPTGTFSYKVYAGTTEKTLSAGLDSAYDDGSGENEEIRNIKYSSISTNNTNYINQLDIDLSGITDTVNEIARSGIEGFYVSVDGGTATKIQDSQISTGLGGETSGHYIITLDNDFNDKVYAISVKDNIGNSKLLKTFRLTADNTAPDFALAGTTGTTTRVMKSEAENGSSASSCDAAPSSTSTNEVYYLNKDYAVINFTKSHSDITSYQVSTDDGSTWSPITTTVDTSNATHTVSYVLATPTDATTYKFKAVDDVLNETIISTTITLQKDTADPINDVSYFFKKEEPAGTVSAAIGNTYYIDNADDTATTRPIIYNADEINRFELDLSAISDATSGIRRFWLTTGTGDTATEIALTDSTTPAISSNKCLITLATADNTTQTYIISAEDWAGNKRALKTFTLTSDAAGPGFTMGTIQAIDSASQTNNAWQNTTTGTYYLRGETAVINFTKTGTDIVKYEVKAVTGGTGDYGEIPQTLTDENGNPYANPNLEISDNAVVYKFDAPTAATTYTFKFTDRVGHVQEMTTDAKTLVKDTTPPTLGTDFVFAAYKDSTPAQIVDATHSVADYTVSTNTETGVITINYNPTKVNNLVFDLSDIVDTGSGIEKFHYKGGSEHEMTLITGTGYKMTLENNWSNKTYQIIAKDNAGNVSGTLKTIVFNADSTGPSFTFDDSSKIADVSWNGRDTYIKQVKGYVSVDNTGTQYDIPFAKWVKRDTRQRANVYRPGTKLKYAISEIPEAVQYQFAQSVTTHSGENAGSPENDGYNASYNNDNWVDMSVDGTDYYVFDLSNIHIQTPYTRLSLFFRDSLGNVSGPYFLGNNAIVNNQSQIGIQWWIEAAPLTADKITIASVTYNNGAGSGWNADSPEQNYTVTVQLPVGTIIKSVFLAPKPTPNVNSTGLVLSDSLSLFKFSGYGTGDESPNTKLKKAYDSEGFIVLPSSAGSLYGELEIGVYPHSNVTDPSSALIKFNGADENAEGVSKQIFTSVNTNINRFGNLGFTLGDGSGESAGARLVQFFNSFVSKDEEALTSTAVDNSIAEKASKTKKAAKKAKKAAKKNNKKDSDKVVSTGSTTGRPGMAVDAAEILAQNEKSTLPEIAVATETVVNEIAGITEKASGEAEVVSIRPTGYSTTESSAATTVASADTEAQSAGAPEAAADKRTPSRSASIVIMLAILSSFGAVWYLQRNRKK